MQTKHLCVLVHIWTKGEVGVIHCDRNFVLRYNLSS